MPYATTSSTIDRQWIMLKSIPSRPPGITARDLTQRLRDAGYNVTKRTVLRDLLTLSRIFGLISNEVSVPYGWYWMNDKRCWMESIELADAASMTLAEQVLERALPSSINNILKAKFKLAHSKLDELGDHRYARWAAKVRYLPDNPVMLPPTIEAEVLDAVYEGLLREQKLEVTYKAFQNEEKEYILHPLCLIIKGHVPYLVATAFDFEDIRLYVLHRICKATAVPEPASIPETFSIDNYLQTGALAFGTNEIFTLKARLSAELGAYLKETPLSTEQKILEKSDGWQITAKVRDSWQLHLWILSQGRGITVLAPKRLRQRIADELQGAWEAYR